MEYDRIDTYGNLLDTTGQVVYRAGDASAPIDTHPGDDMAYRLYEDPHESPRAKVARGTSVPRIPASGEAYGSQAGALAPGVYGLDDGRPMALPGSSPGVHHVAQPRVRQFAMENRGLDRDGMGAIRVEQGLSYGAVNPQLQHAASQQPAFIPEPVQAPAPAPL